MRTMILTALAAGAALVVLSAGCGSKENAVQADTAPFEAAIRDYLDAKSMGMKVSEFRSLTVEGDKAHAVCRMREQSELHRAGVTWRFEFSKSRQGTWQVTGRSTE